MKKIFIITTIACLTFFSCQKEAETNSSRSLRTGSASASSASTNSDFVGKDDLTGSQWENFCTGEIMTALSGDLVYNVAPDGNLRNLTLHNFVLQTPDGTIYRANYIVTFELITSGGFINTYKFIANPQHSGTHMVLQGQLKVTESTVQFDKFSIKCN